MPLGPVGCRVAVRRGAAVRPQAGPGLRGKARRGTRRAGLLRGDCGRERAGDISRPGRKPEVCAALGTLARVLHIAKMSDTEEVLNTSSLFFSLF